MERRSSKLTAWANKAESSGCIEYCRVLDNVCIKKIYFLIKVDFCRNQHVDKFYWSRNLIPDPAFVFLDFSENYFTLTDAVHCTTVSSMNSDCFWNASHARKAFRALPYFNSSMPKIRSSSIKRSLSLSNNFPHIHSEKIIYQLKINYFDWLAEFECRIQCIQYSIQ